MACSQPEFLSTLSLRRATCRQVMLRPRAAYFYPRSPCGERRSYFRPYRECVSISIHALLAESDGGTTTSLIAFDGFLSTLSLRRATVFISYYQCVAAYFYPRSPCGERRLARRLHPAGRTISIHALLAESDGIRVFDQVRIFLFLSTLSLRRATEGAKAYMVAAGFLSTLSLRRATYVCQ